jgi:hypothetical protein
MCAARSWATLCEQVTFVVRSDGHRPDTERHIDRRTSYRECTDAESLLHVLVPCTSAAAPLETACERTVGETVLVCLLRRMLNLGGPQQACTEAHGQLRRQQQRQQINHR